jgi:transposase
MRHENSVFHGLSKHIPWAVFDRLVDEHEADRRVRRLATRSQFLALLYGQLSGAASLREIEAGLASHRARLYHLGSEAPSRSTLADANAKRPCEVFAGLFAHMVGQASSGLRKKIGETVRLIDSTGLKLSAASGWARFSAEVCGAKLHVVYDPAADRPLYAAITAARVNDITPAKAMPIEPGATYVFDLGYYDYGWWAELDRAHCRIVTRFKKNTPLAVLDEMPLEPGSPVLSDRIGHLPERMARSRKNPFQNPVREVRVRTETGKELRILTNDLDAPAEQIAELYKRRWQIELFFRWIKHTLKIRDFLGT